MSRKHFFTLIISYIRKLFKFDWVRAVQFFLNTREKLVILVQFEKRIVAFDWITNNIIGFGKHQSNLFLWWRDMQSSKS